MVLLGMNLGRNAQIQNLSAPTTKYMIYIKVWKPRHFNGANRVCGIFYNLYLIRNMLQNDSAAYLYWYFHLEW